MTPRQKNGWLGLYRAIVVLGMSVISYLQSQAIKKQDEMQALQEKITGKFTLQQYEIDELKTSYISHTVSDNERYNKVVQGQHDLELLVYGLNPQKNIRHE